MIIVGELLHEIQGLESWCDGRCTVVRKSDVIDAISRLNIRSSDPLNYTESEVLSAYNRLLGWCSGAKLKDQEMHDSLIFEGYEHFKNRIFENRGGGRYYRKNPALSLEEICGRIDSDCL